MKNIIKFVLTILISSVILLITGYIFSDNIFSALTYYAKAKGIDFTVNTIVEALIIKMKVTIFFLFFFINLVLTFSLWLFFLKNRKYLLHLFLGNVSYIIGILLYLLILNQLVFKPIVNVKTTIEAQTYINKLFLGFLIGIIFELPLVAYVLFSLVKESFFKKK